MATRKKVEPLGQKIVRWHNDFPAYCREALHIKTKEGTLIPFELNRAQLRFWKKIERELRLGKPVRAYILKARQLGFSTVIKAVEYWLVTLHPFRNSLTVSHSMSSASELFSKCQVFYNMSPSFARPACQRSNRKELKFAKNPTDAEIEAAEAAERKPDIGLQSSLLVQTADNAHLGASLTLHFVHLSEFARYEKIRSDVQTSMATLMATVPNLPKTFVFIETTAWGLGYSKDFWDKDDNGFLKIFVSWVADDKYKHEEWHEELPQGLSSLEDSPEGQYGDEENDSLPRVRSELRDWYPDECEDPKWFAEEVLKRLAWRRRSIRIDHQGNLDLFRQEYPLYAEEAFLTSGDHVFDTRKLSDLRQALYTVYDDGSKELARPAERFRFHKTRRGFYEGNYGPLRVYRAPEYGKRYVVGADVSEGVSQGDASAAVVLSLPEMEQVAVYQSGYRNDKEVVEPIDPDDFADVLDVIGRLYNDAFICCEVNGPGFATNLKLGKKLKYPRIYRREVFDAKTKTVLKKYGWQSNKSTKNVAITDLRAAIRDDEILLYDLYTIDELNHYVKNGTKLEAAKGKHDDLVIALSLAIQMSRTGHFGGTKSSARQPRASNVEGTFDWWTKKAHIAARRRQ